MITVSKEVLITTGKFENIKIIASITASDDNFEIAWKDLNDQIREQETLERTSRLGIPTPSADGWKNTKDEEPLPF